ncbi:MAG: pentapeptide repeat-containing protein, partial [Myxococcota bacterium]|nr:pentapeptide repeat-containing protein [Myxococcota bacterium]
FANLEGADLDFANLEGVTLRSARIRKATFPLKKVTMNEIEDAVVRGKRLCMNPANLADEDLC